MSKEFDDYVLTPPVLQGEQDRISPKEMLISLGFTYKDLGEVWGEEFVIYNGERRTKIIRIERGAVNFGTEFFSPEVIQLVLDYVKEKGI